MSMTRFVTYILTIFVTVEIYYTRIFIASLLLVFTLIRIRKTLWHDINIATALHP